jgi:hypothetical protein
MVCHHATIYSTVGCRGRGRPVPPPHSLSVEGASPQPDPEFDADDMAEFVQLDADAKHEEAKEEMAELAMEQKEE